MRKDTPLPPELRQKWGDLPHLIFRGSNEWSAMCPKCHDYGHVGNEPPDRFRLFGPDANTNGRAWCRRCGHFEWADDGIEPFEPPSPEAWAAAEAERVRLAKLEIERQQKKIKSIEQAAFWQGWHERMTEEHRKAWERQGIIPYFQDYYKLGFTDNYTYYHDGETLMSPAFTIPHYGEGWHLTNIQYRLTKPACGAGKYRQTAGLPAAMFLTEPDEPLTGGVLVVEGAKKAIVTYTNIDTNLKLTIVAIPSKTPSADMLELLHNAEQVYLALDPDAYWPTFTKDGQQMTPAINRIAKRLDSDRVIIVKLPCKPDDLFTKYGGKTDDLTAFIKQGVKA